VQRKEENNKDDNNNVNKNPTDATVCRYLFTASIDSICSFAVNKYLHTVASVGFLLTLNYDARNHELKKNDNNNKCFISLCWKYKYVIEWNKMIYFLPMYSIQM